MTITKNRLKKLEDKAKLTYTKDEIIIKYQIPNGELITLAYEGDFAIIPSDEMKSVKEIRGKCIEIDRVVGNKYDLGVGDKLLYEREDFKILDQSNDKQNKD